VRVLFLPQAINQVVPDRTDDDVDLADTETGAADFGGTGAGAEGDTTPR
jgi:hypothetical protein